jgi:hypothetical protein
VIFPSSSIVSVTCGTMLTVVAASSSTRSADARSRLV